MFKKSIIFVVLLATLLISVPYCGTAQTQQIAQSTSAASCIREYFPVANVGSTVTVTTEAVPGSEVLLKVFNFGGINPEFNDAVSIMENICYFNQKTADENGFASFEFTVNEAGGYNAAVYGDVYSIDVSTSGGNAVDDSQPTELPMYLNAGANGDLPENCYNSVFITRADTIDVEKSAPHIAKVLKNMPEGGRIIFYSMQISSMLYNNSVYEPDGDDDDTDEDLVKDKMTSYIYGETVEQAYAAMEGLFKKLHELGAEVDYVIGDAEDYMTAEYLRGLSGNNRLRALNELVQHEKYETEFRPQLEKRGFVFTEPDYTVNPPRSELGNFLNTDNGSYYAFNKTVVDMQAKVANAALYEPIKKWYPNVKMCNYDNYESRAWNLGHSGESGLAHWINGNSYGTWGTGSSPVLYVQYNRYVYGGNLDLTEVEGKRISGYYKIYHNMVNILKNNNMNRVKGKTMPWIYTKNFENSDYYSEFFYHTALSNPEIILLFNPAGSMTVQEQIDDYTFSANLLSDVNSLIGSSDRENIPLPTSDVEQPYFISGCSAAGYSYFRITRDVDNSSDFAVKNENGSLRISIGADGEENAYEITFAGGEVITTENENNAPNGIWVKAPIGVLPEERVNLSSKINGSAEFAAILFESKYGVMIGESYAGVPAPETGESYTALVRYDNKSSKDIEMRIVAAKYKGNKLSGIEILSDKTARRGTNGEFVFHISEIESGETSLKLMLWNDDGSLSPIKEAREYIPQ